MNAQVSEGKEKALVVAAIDFGTTYSGWAFSFKHDFERDPINVSAKTWLGGQLTSLKGPTCILIKPDGKTLEAFAYDAETRYSELSEKNKHKKWFYFRRFKMALWKKSIHKDTVLEDECGRELLALTVFSLSIKFMKDNLFEKTESQVSGLKEDDIHWVLTVPAIWNDSAKQFMRMAAEQAGISSDKLTLALEPEAASLYCRHLPVKKDGDCSLSTLKAGTKYLVLDAGGGTIDITVHEVCTGGTLKEVHKATGGEWGGTNVDAAFMEFLGKITDEKAIQKFKDDNMEDYIELFRDFEIKKRAIDTSKTGKITIKVPLSLIDHVRDVTKKKLKDKLQSSGYGEKVTLAGDKIRLDADIMRSFFSTSWRKSSNMFLICYKKKNAVASRPF
ncbi:heat shock 70 kDa protein 12A-like [Dreissena polymorpha]|nr:heat shock 70 kDa protein 12A-like [Dreissena polymorpha]